MLVILLSLAHPRRLLVMGTAPIVPEVTGAHITATFTAEASSSEEAQKKIGKLISGLEKKAGKLNARLTRNHDIRLEGGQGSVEGQESIELQVDDLGLIQKVISLVQKSAPDSKIQVELEEGFPDDQYETLYQAAFEDASQRGQTLATLQNHRIKSLDSVEVWHTNDDSLFKVVLEYQLEPLSQDDDEEEAAKEKDGEEEAVEDQQGQGKQQEEEDQQQEQQEEQEEEEEEEKASAKEVKKNKK